jgi:hypothetical protein
MTCSARRATTASSTQSTTTRSWSWSYGSATEVTSTKPCGDVERDDGRHQWNAHRRRHGVGIRGRKPAALRLTMRASHPFVLLDPLLTTHRPRRFHLAAHCSDHSELNDL